MIAPTFSIGTISSKKKDHLLGGHSLYEGAAGNRKKYGISYSDIVGALTERPSLSEFLLAKKHRKFRYLDGSTTLSQITSGRSMIAPTFSIGTISSKKKDHLWVAIRFMKVPRGIEKSKEATSF